MAYAPFDLSGKVALITGGNSGIGLGMARALAEAGADIAIWGSNPAKNAAALESLKLLGVRLHAVVCDIGDEAAVEAAFAETLTALGRVDACFANAGTYGHASRFTALETAEWQRVMRINLDGAFFTLRAAARHMVERGGGGSLVATASLAAIEGAARNAHYGATKGALVAMIRALAVELARHGIRANAILPGWIESDMTAPAFSYDTFVQKVMPRIPTRRWGTKEDFAGIATYLASSASTYHTGDIIRIDGGFHSF